jgi:mannosyltransferase
VNRAPGQTILTPFRIALILAVTTIVGALLRLHQLSVKSFWIDEGASVSFATMPWRPFLKTLWNYQGNMTLYYFLLRAWIHLGDSEFVVRSLSVIFAVLTIPAIYLLGKRLFDRFTGLIAAALLAVHSFHIHWSQEARGYSLLLLLLVVAAYFLVCALQSKAGRILWVAFAVTAAMSFYAHIFAVLVLIAFAVSIAFPKPYRIEKQTIVWVAILFEHLIAPMALFVLVHHSGSQIGWLPPPSLAAVNEFFLLLTSQGGIALAAIYLSLCGLAFMLASEASQPEKERWALRLLFLWLVLPPALTLAVTPVKPLFYGRYMVICVPALVLLAARGLTLLYHAPMARRGAALAAFMLVMTLSGWGTHKYFTRFPQESTDWRAAVNYIRERQQPGDGVFIYTSHALSYDYYAHPTAKGTINAAPEVLYPPDPRRPLSHDEIVSDIAGRQRVWLLLHDEKGKPAELAEVQSTIGEEFQAGGKQVFPGEIPITVVLYSHVQGAKQEPSHFQRGNRAEKNHPL